MQPPGEPLKHSDAPATAEAQLGVCLRNYGEVFAPAVEQLKGLQDWIRSQSNGD